MYFEQPWYFLFLLLAPLVFLFPRAKRALPVSWACLVKETSAMRLLRVTCDSLVKIAWCLTLLIVIAVLAWPLRDIHNSLRTERVRKICLVADVSTSMSGEGIKRLKEILHAFVDKRKGDWMCLTAYSGIFGKEGGARVIQPLTPDVTLMHQGIDRLEPKMLGSHTAIGEGIWTTVFALREPQLKLLERKNVKIDLSRLREEMKSGSRSYFEYLTSLLGVAENEIMVFFTDGFYNTGLHPSVAVPLVIQLGIRMYMGVMVPTGATGLSEETALQRLEELKRAAKNSRGDYFRGENYDEISKFYAKIDSVEKRDMVVEVKDITQPVFREIARYLPFVSGILILVSVTYIHIRGRRRDL